MRFPALAVAIAAASAGAQGAGSDAACGAMTPPKDAYVIGSVSDASNRPVAGATISLGWLEAKYTKSEGLRLLRYDAEATSDSLGRYAICGVARNTTLNVYAVSGSLSTGLLELPPQPKQVQRRDLMVGASPDSTAERVVVRGVVRTRMGRPVPNARVITAGTPEVRTGEDGRFSLGAAPGTRQIEVLSLGSLSASTIVDVGRDTTPIVLEMQRVTQLAAITVTASAVRQRRVADIADRERLGISKHIDSVKIARYNQLIYAIEQLTPLDHICGGQVRIDGFLFDTTELRFRFPWDFAHIEVVRGGMTPLEYKPVKAGSNQIPDCSVVLLWTKLGMP